MSDKIDLFKLNHDLENQVAVVNITKEAIDKIPKGDVAHFTTDSNKIALFLDPGEDRDLIIIDFKRTMALYNYLDQFFGGRKEEHEKK